MTGAQIQKKVKNISTQFEFTHLHISKRTSNITTVRVCYNRSGRYSAVLMICFDIWLSVLQLNKLLFLLIPFLKKLGGILALGSELSVAGCFERSSCRKLSDEFILICTNQQLLLTLSTKRMDQHKKKVSENEGYLRR